MKVPMTKIGDVEVSRIICGSNTFFGYSHFSAAKDTWLRRYFDIGRIVEILNKCAEYGINCVISGPDERMKEAREELERQTGWHMNWVCTPGMAGWDLRDDIKRCADWGVEICAPHTSWTDARLNIHKQEIEGLEPYLEQIRSLGMATGLSTHRPEVIVVGDAAGYDLDMYIQPLNVIGFLCAVETDWVARVIQNTTKTVICIKPFAAGRVMPEPGLGYVLRNCKSIDAVAMGFMSPEEVEEDVRIGVAIMEQQKVEIPLTRSRSKRLLEATPEK